jgi:hypothetical protein
VSLCSAVDAPPASGRVARARPPVIEHIPTIALRLSTRRKPSPKTPAHFACNEFLASSRAPTQFVYDNAEIVDNGAQ